MRAIFLVMFMLPLLAFAELPDVCAVAEDLLKDKKDWVITTRKQAEHALFTSLPGPITATQSWHLRDAIMLPGDAGNVGKKDDWIWIGILTDPASGRGLPFAPKAIFLINARTGMVTRIAEMTELLKPNKTPLPTPVERPPSNHDQVPGAADL